MTNFKVGDRVICCNPAPEGTGYVYKGTIISIGGISDAPFCIKYDDNNKGPWRMSEGWWSADLMQLEVPPEPFEGELTLEI